MFWRSVTSFKIAAKIATILDFTKTNNIYRKNAIKLP